MLQKSDAISTRTDTILPEIKSPMANLQINKSSLLSIINASPVGMLLIDKLGKPVFSNSACEEIFAVSKDALHDMSISDLIPLRLRKKHNRLQKNYMAQPKSIQMGKQRQVKALRNDGKEITVEVGLSAFVIDSEHYILVSIIDVSDRLRVKELEAINRELEVAASYDMLTGLPNRRLIYSLIDNQKNLAVRSGARITVMFIDLDGFKSVNDQYGHDVGDRLLCKVAEQLGTQIRKSDILGRLGGDEFLMCFTELGDRFDVERMSNHLLRTISDIKSVDGFPIVISASIGVCYMSMKASSDVEEIVRAVDKLMYEAKKRGKGVAVIKEC